MKRLKIKFARRPFSLARDDAGVPHIAAEDWLGALYGLGYAHALDRPTQMFFAHAVASGRSAELIADRPEMVETDRFFRRAGLFSHLAEEVRRLEPATLDQLQAYCDGIDDGLRQGGRSLPMRATGFQPEAWTPAAVLLVGNLLNFGGLVVSQLQNERLLIELIQAGVDRAKLAELFEPMLEDADFDLISKINISNRLSDEALELITDLPRMAGSNAWAVRPERSATGAALLAADPHLEVNRLPAIWHESVLMWGENGEHYVMGASLPGCPIFGIARTRDLAWGVTYLKGDTCDYFIEDCRKGENGPQYLRGQEWRDFAARDEIILRKNNPPETFRVYSSDTGALDIEGPIESRGYYLTTLWAGASLGSGRSIETWMRMVPCKTTREAMDTVADCPTPTLCWIFADREGHVGRQANGWFPERNPKHNGLLPTPAWDTANHWKGWHSPASLPSVYDPPEGFVSSANENINPPGGPMLITQPIPEYRKRRIDEQLRELPLATLDDMQKLQYDVVSLQARDLLEVFLPCLDDGPLKTRLSEWKCDYTPESEDAALFAHLYRNVLLEVFGHGGGLGWRRMLYLSTRAGFSMMVVCSLDRVLKKQDSLWWAGRDKCELIRQAANRVNVTAGETWADVNSFRFTNRFLDSQIMGRALGAHTSDIPMPGCHATPFQGHLLRTGGRETTFAPSYHFVTSMSDDEAWTNLPGGPKESWLSRWYKSDIPRWRSGHYKPLRCSEGTGNRE